MASDLDQLIEMGFDKERAQLAVTKTGGLQGALQWLEDNQDKSLEEIKAQAQEAQGEEGPALQPGEQPRSLVCNECGKKFRGQSQAEFHASKSGHVDFAESTEEVAPLTEEQKKQRLAELREKLAEKRAGLSEQDKIDKKRNEEIRRKSTKETQDAKEELERKQQMKEAAKKKKEKQDEIEAKKRIKAKIEADKEERRLKAEKQRAERAGVAPPSPPPSRHPPPPAPLHLSLPLPIRKLGCDSSHPRVAAALKEQDGIEVQSFVQNFPKKVFDNEFFGESLKELGLVPSASLLIQ
ncbi:hypothetical protein N7505_000473 [Penicillium chrysogenum]|uniref:UBA domain-containing protein n=1 Tax=Penicillium chrysogenum TaxID=5076 RepID=A0ABQ8WTY0_PENCH|nr:hypothetical protein N7505_000473 [Penicillium chrysogenum]